MHDVNKCGGTLNTACWVSTKSGQEKHHHDGVCRLDCWRKNAVGIVPASFKHVCRARTQWSCTCLHLFSSTFFHFYDRIDLFPAVTHHMDTSQMWPRTSTFFQAAYQPARSCIDTTNYGPCQTGSYISWNSLIKVTSSVGANSMDDSTRKVEHPRPRSMTKIDLQT